MSASLGAWILILDENPIGPIRLAFSFRSLFHDLNLIIGQAIKFVDQSIDFRVGRMNLALDYFFLGG
jgi:hypothetical protein